MERLKRLVYKNEEAGIKVYSVLQGKEKSLAVFVHGEEINLVKNGEVIKPVLNYLIDYAKK